MDNKEPKVNERRVEALVMAIGHLHGWSHNPDSPSYQMHNPLMVRSFALPGRHEINEEGVRVFKSSLAGLKGCIYDCSLKVAAQSRAGLKEDDKLANLLRVYGISQVLGQKQVVRYLRRALSDESISVDTPLSYFRSLE